MCCGLGPVCLGWSFWAFGGKVAFLAFGFWLLTLCYWLL
uniref:Uncharacterized protein n=1 Tax=Arundo donax TaxID=35708 RepID=A0A0A9EYQ7_ARUDO